MSLEELLVNGVPTPAPVPAQSPLAFRRSPSQRGTYISCGQKWAHQYLGKWQPKLRRGSFEFGAVVHNVVGLMLAGCIPPERAAEAFTLQWEVVRAQQERHQWSTRQTWELFAARGPALLEVCARELPSRLRYVRFLEQRLTYGLGAETEELAIIDLAGEVRTESGLWVPGIVDFKTSDRRYSEIKHELHPQLMSQYLGARHAGWPVAQIGLVVLIYGTRPDVQWLLRGPFEEQQLSDFAEHALLVDAQIRAGLLMKNTSACEQWGACPYIPLCYPSQHGRIDAELTCAVETTVVPDDVVWDEQ